MNISLTPQQVNDLFGRVREVLADTKKGVTLSGAIKEKLKTNSSSIQSIFDTIFNSAGITTQEKLDELDEKIKQQKLDLLKARANRTKNVVLILSIVAVAGIGLLLYFTNKKTK